MKDSVVEEVRKIRHEIELDYGQDIDKYLEHIYAEQKKHGKKLICRQPKLLHKRRAM
jgi:hypothetical protein